MARGVQFSELLSRLREELGRSNSPAVGVDDKPALQRAINRNYKMLAAEHDWPFLRRVFTKIAMQENERYYDFPSELDPERVEVVNVWWNGIPHPIRRGIAFEEYAGFDSEEGETSDPILAWDIRNIAGSTQFEVWPLPGSTNTQSVQFIGFVTVTDLVNDADQCVLDDEMITLYAAAQLLARQKSEDASVVLQQATRRFRLMKSRASGGGSTPTRIGLGLPEEHLPRTRAIVRVN